MRELKEMSQHSSHCHWRTKCVGVVQKGSSLGRGQEAFVNYIKKHRLLEVNWGNPMDTSEDVYVYFLVVTMTGGFNGI